MSLNWCVVNKIISYQLNIPTYYGVVGRTSIDTQSKIGIQVITYFIINKKIIINKIKCTSI